MRACKPVRCDLSLAAAVPAADFHGKKFGFNPRAFRDRSLREHVQVDLDALGDDAAQAADAQADNTDPRRVLLFGGFQAVVEKVFCDGKFMHCLSSCSGAGVQETQNRPFIGRIAVCTLALSDIQSTFYHNFPL